MQEEEETRLAAVGRWRRRHTAGEGTLLTACAWVRIAIPSRHPSNRTTSTEGGEWSSTQGALINLGETGARGSQDQQTDVPHRGSDGLGTASVSRL